MKSRSLQITSVLFSLLIAAATASFAQTFTTLVNFEGTNGTSPDTWLIQGTDGSFYGTTQYGGSRQFGTVYKVNSAGMLTTLAIFNGPNGRLPTGLLLASDAKQWATIKWEVTSIRDKFGPETELGKRRTQFADAPEHDLTDIAHAMIEREPVTVVVSEKGWLRAMSYTRSNNHSFQTVPSSAAFALPASF